MSENSTIMVAFAALAIVVAISIVLIVYFSLRAQQKIQSVKLTELPPARYGRARCCSPCCHDHNHTSKDAIDLAPLPVGAVPITMSDGSAEEIYPFRVVQVGDEIEIVHPDGDYDGMAWIGDDAASAIEYAQSLAAAFTAGIRARDDVFGRLAAGEIVEHIALSEGMETVIRLRRAYEDLDRKRVH